MITVEHIPSLRCSFCHCSMDDIGSLVQGCDPTTFICERCLREGLECLVLTRRQTPGIAVSFSRDSSLPQQSGTSSGA